MRTENCAMRWALPLLLTAMFYSIAASAEDVIKKTSSGGINWTKGIVYANGYGTAKPGLSAAQRRILSRRAAIVDGQRNLLEITKGVRINSVLKTGQAMQNPEIATRVSGIIKGAQPIDENYQNDIYSVTMAMPISGEFLKVMYPKDGQSPVQTSYNIVPPDAAHFALHSLDVATDTVLDFLIMPAAAAEPIVIRNDHQADAYRKLLDWMKNGTSADVKPMLMQAIKNYETNSQFSGLLIDASSISDFQLATIPKIRDQDGNVVYPSDQTNYDDIINNRGVTYDYDLQDAVRNKRVAHTPFVIKAIATYKNLPSDLVITSADAKRLAQSPSTMASMNNAGVLIVVPL